MKTTLSVLAVALLASTPASAHVIVAASDVDFSSSPFTVSVDGRNSFTFTYDALGQFDPSPVLINTSGNAAVTAIFGVPSVDFTNPPATFGPDSFPGFSSVSTPTRAPSTLTASDLGLRYGTNGNYFYGYARFYGSHIASIAFESEANTPIIAGSVPEPATWGMLIFGFGAIGAAMRYRRGEVKVRFA